MDSSHRAAPGSPALHLHISAPPHELQVVEELQLSAQSALGSWEAECHALARGVRAEPASWLQIEDQTDGHRLLVHLPFTRNHLINVFVFIAEVRSTRRKGVRQHREEGARAGGGWAGQEGSPAAKQHGE